MDFASLTPLAGGWSGETFLGEVAGEPCVVRIYARPSHRGAAAAEVDAALLRLVRGLLPVPEVLEVRRADPATGTPALVITRLLPGRRVDELLPGLDEEQQAVLGRNLGLLLADLGGIPMARSGRFVDDTLRVEPFPGPADLGTWVEQHLEFWPDWSAGEKRGLRIVAESAQDLLDTVSRRCLVHSDLNAKNLLTDPETLELTGLVDWEYAHAGHPFTDLGNLVRFERQAPFVEGVLDSYTRRRGGSPEGVLDLARAADLWALVDLAARPPDNLLVRAARALLQAIARTGDLHAWPTAD